MTRFTLGDYHCTVLHVGQFTISADTLFANASARDRFAVLEKYGLDPAALVFQINPLFVDTGQIRVLVDPGAGFEANRLIQALESAGIEPASIDTVIITHGHSDHYDGCVDADGHPAFPQARYYIQRAEWEHWLAENNPEPQHAEDFRKMLFPIHHCFSLLEGDGEIVPGIEAITTPGHSPGHMSVLIDGRLMCVGDVMLHVVYIERPDWFAAFDVEPERVVQNRRKLLQRLADHKLWVSGYHFDLPGTGRVVADGHTWKWIPEPIP